MGYYDAYNAILSVTIPPRDRNVNITKRAITTTFKNNPSYYPVTVNTPSLPYPLTPSALDLWVVDDPSKTKEVKQIQLIPNQVLNYGDLISWQGDYWLTTTIDFMGGIYYRGSMSKCVSSLKWKDSLGATKEAFFTPTKDTQTGLGVVDGKVMVIPAERRYLTIQNNVDTIKIEKFQRFIFDNNRCWRVTSEDALKTGIIELTLEETELNLELDDVASRIANANLHSYTIDITNGTSVNLITGGTLQLNVVTKDNGTVASLPVTYTSLTPSIATVNSSGLITALISGSVTIKASLTNSPTIFATISVVVSVSVVAGYVLSISGSDFCKVTQSQVYSGVITNNGVTDGTKTISFSIKADDGVSSTTLATITSSTSSNMTIKGNSTSNYGYIRVIGTCIQDGSIVGNKRVQIKALI